MSAPLVSVCVPARDAERFLGDALASALRQDVALELLVCDDGSHDATAAVAARFAARDPRVRVLRHARGRGVVAARNALLAAARGRYVAWLDADDAYLPNALVEQVAVLERDPRIALVHGAPQIVDEDGRKLPPWRAPFPHDAVEDGSRAFGEWLCANEVTTSTVVVRRAAHVAAGPFVSVGPSSSDWDVWLRLALHGAVAYRAEPIARYRQHPASISHAASASGARLRCDARVVRRALRSERVRLLDRPALARRARTALAAKALLQAGDFHTRGERRAALRALALAARMRPDLALAASGGLLPPLASAATPPRDAPLGNLAQLAAATARGDDYAAHVASTALLERLAGALVGTRYGDVIAARAAPDPDWDATLARVARTVERVTPPDAVLGTVTKWDPTLLRLSGRCGRNFPDRATLPDGYPADDATAVAHLEQQRAAGVTHLVFPDASRWWLDHYAGLAERLPAPLHADADCLIFDLDAAA